MLTRALVILALPAALAVPVTAASRLEVARITREPRQPPPTSLTAPKEEGWPDPGSRIEWIGHVVNRGPQPVSGVAYRWRIDGETVASGRLDVPPGETTVALPWRWSRERERVSFEITPDPAAGDATAIDDGLTIDSDALSLGFWVEQSLYDWMAEGGRPGFERWAQGQIEAWHRVFERAVFETAPRGVLDRMRLDRVVVAPAGGRPQNGELDTDLAWYFPTTRDDGRFLHKDAPANVLADQTIVLHELLHGRGLIDLYAYTVVHGDQSRTDSLVDIRENGRLVAGTSLMPARTTGLDGFTVFLTNINGVMGSLYREGANLTEHCVNGLNRRAGRRTPLWFDQWGNLINGFSNAAQPDSYALALSARSELRILDQNGAPVVNADVDVYRDGSMHTYQKRYGATPDRTYKTDARGVVVLPGDLLDGLPPSNAPPKSMTLILGVRTPGARGFFFLPVWELNLLQFRDPERGEIVVNVKLEPR